MPDHGNLLANLVRWASRDTIPLQAHGAGLLNCELYHQPGRAIVHVVNLTSAGSWRAPVDELIPVGPLQVRVRPPAGVRARTARALVGGRALPVTMENGWASVQLASVTDHEVIVLE
jgi:hypothetical protein